MILSQNKQSTVTQNTQNQASNSIFCKSEQFPAATQIGKSHKAHIAKTEAARLPFFLYIVSIKIDILSMYFALFACFQAKSRMPNNRLAAKFEIYQP